MFIPHHRLPEQLAMRHLSRSLPSPRLTVLAIALAPAMAGCNPAFLGNLVVMGLTVGIFFATLALGRTSADASRADGSTATRSTTAHPSA